MSKKRLISIVIPAYNEQDNIKLIYKALKSQLRALSAHDYELLFVNDGSTDQTQSAIDALQKKDKRVSCVEFVRNFGKEAATTAGLHTARGDAVIMIDADLQHPAEVIPTFVTHWEQGSEVVIGVRNHNPGSSWLRTFRSKMFYKLLNRVADTAIMPNGTDFQLLDRVVVNEFNRLTERGRITRGLISWLGFPTMHVPFDANDRVNGDASYGTVKLFRLAINSFVSLSLFPLKLAGYLGVGISLLAGTLGLFMFINRFLLNDPFGFSFSGPAILAVFILFLVGILLSCLGLVALYIGNIHGEVTKRPLYVVRRRG